jgi:hypothetical protein
MSQNYAEKRKKICPRNRLRNTRCKGVHAIEGPVRSPDFFRVENLGLVCLGHSTMFSFQDKEADDEADDNAEDDAEDDAKKDVDSQKSSGGNALIYCDVCTIYCKGDRAYQNHVVGIFHAKQAAKQQEEMLGRMKSSVS